MNMNPDTKVAYLRSNEPESAYTSYRQLETLRLFWEQKYGDGPNTQVCMVFSVVLLIVLHVIAFPVFLFYGTYKALQA